MFNVIEVSELGLNRICRCPLANVTASGLSEVIAQYANKPCNTLSHAKKCPLFQHYTGADSSEVVQALTDDFLQRLSDPVKRSASFKNLHMLSLLVYEQDKFKLSLLGQFRLWLIYHFMQKKYTKYLVAINTPAKTWDTIVQSFKEALVISHQIQED